MALPEQQRASSTDSNSGGGGGGGSSSASSWTNLWSWPFVAPLQDMHVRGLVERVKQVNMLYYAEGTSLLIKAWEKVQQHKQWLQSSAAAAAAAAGGGGTSTPAPLSLNPSESVGSGAGGPGPLVRVVSDNLAAAATAGGRLYGSSGWNSGYANNPEQASVSPYLQMSFHLAGLATHQFQLALKYCLDDPLSLCNLSFVMTVRQTTQHR
jgi:hypothetical protein